MDLDNNTKISLYTIDLILNVKNNDLEQIKSIIPDLNLILETQEQFNEILFNFDALIDDYNNESLLYIVKNIKNIDDIRRQKLLWKITMQNLIGKNNYEEINNFIEDALAEPRGKLFQFQVSILIKLASFSKNFEQLQNIHTFIKEGRVI